MQPVHKLNKLQRVGGAHDHIIIPQPVVISPVGIKQFSTLQQAYCGKGDPFTGHQGMAKVQCYAYIFSVHVFHKAHGIAQIGCELVDTRFPHLVFQADLNGWVVVCDALHTVYHPAPDLGVVCLEGVVHTVMGKPQCDIFNTHLCGNIHAFAHSGNGFLTKCFRFVCE